MLGIIKDYDPKCIKSVTAAYEDCKRLGYYDQMKCMHCNKTVDRYLFEAHKSICKKKGDK